MIDHNLIKAGTKHSKHVLAMMAATDCKDLYFFQNFLYPPLLNKIREFVSSEDDVGPGWLGRREITWLPDSVIEETYTVIENLTNTINDKLNVKQKFNGISIWKDWGSFQARRHSDRETINTSLQVYLNSTETNLATQFECNGEIICPKYVANAGYLLNNQSKPIHWMKQPIPKNFNRYSLFATWSVTKHAEPIHYSAAVRRSRSAYAARMLGVARMRDAEAAAVREWITSADAVVRPGRHEQTWRNVGGALDRAAGVRKSPSAYAARMRDAVVRHDGGALDRGSATEPYKYPPTHKGLAK